MYACRKHCDLYKNEKTGGLTGGETFKATHQIHCRPDGVPTSNFQRCVYAGCKPKGAAQFTSQGLTIHLAKLKKHGAIGSIVKSLLDPEDQKAEGTLAVRVGQVCFGGQVGRQISPSCRICRVNDATRQPTPSFLPSLAQPLGDEQLEFVARADPWMRAGARRTKGAPFHGSKTVLVFSPVFAFDGNKCVCCRWPHRQKHHMRTWGCFPPLRVFRFCVVHVCSIERPSSRAAARSSLPSRACASSLQMIVHMWVGGPLLLRQTAKVNTRVVHTCINSAEKTQTTRYTINVPSLLFFVFTKRDLCVCVCR